MDTRNQRRSLPPKKNPMISQTNPQVNPPVTTSPQVERPLLNPPNQSPPIQPPSNQVPSENENSLKEKLNRLYTDIKSVPNYSAKIAEFLRQHDTHGPYQRISKRIFPRRRIIARFPFEYFMADLIEYPRTKVINRGYVYILILIDCFTKKVWAAPMKNKTKEASADAFYSILKNFDQFPKHIITDGGLEFFNSSVQKLFHTFGINHYKSPTRTNWKASMAERAIQTIKSRLEKIFDKRGNRKWVDLLDDIIENYNKTPHRMIGMAPQDVTDENRDEVYKRLYPNAGITIVCKLKIGDKVRKIREKSLFDKGYTKKWSDEIYKITVSRQSHSVCWYKIRDLNNKQVPGIWYYYQLKLVARHDSNTEGNPAKHTSKT